MNILHLSDIHFGRNYPCYGIGDNFTKHDQILDELIEVIADTDEHLRPEHIVFTGDIVWHGKAEEYREALDWFRRLLDALNLTGKDISFCVGNHDLDLACLCNDPGIDNNSVAEIDDYYKYENIHKMEFPLYGYNEFCRELGMEPYSYPLDGKRKYSYSAGYKDITFSNGKTVRLLALNTAMLMPFQGISEDKMWLGQEQIKTLINYSILPAPKDIWYTITLCHHSDRFLHPDETSTYNGRPATLSLLLENVNLILCGHTESSGKPRLSKQQGGGSILCGGASYYSDDHINAFSMIYLSERKRSMGFLPYVYEDGWKDYDFEHHFIRADENKILEAEKEHYRNARILFETDEEAYEINCSYLSFSESDTDCSIRFDNSKDIMNPFRIEYDSTLSDSEAVSVKLSDECTDSASANLEYKKYALFAEKAADSQNVRCRIYTEDDKLLFSGHSSVSSDTCVHNISLLKEITELEKIFNIRFRLPNEVTDTDMKKVRLLRKVADSGFRADKNNTAFIASEQSFRMQLFDVTLDLGDTIFEL